MTRLIRIIFKCLWGLDHFLWMIRFKSVCTVCAKVRSEADNKLTASTLPAVVALIIPKNFWWNGGKLNGEWDHHTNWEGTDTGCSSLGCIACVTIAQEFTRKLQRISIFAVYQHDAIAKLLCAACPRPLTLRSYLQHTLNAIDMQLFAVYPHNATK